MLKSIINFIKSILLNNSIIRNVFITFFIANFMMMIALGTTLIRDSTNALTKDAEKYNYKIVEQVTIGLNNMLNEIKEPLYVLSRNRSVIEVMLNYDEMGMGDKLTYDREIEELSYSMSQYKPIIRDVLILGENGYTMNLKTAKPIDPAYDFTVQQWYLQSTSSDAVKITSLGLHQEEYYYSRYNNTEKTLSISIPVHDHRGHVIGSIICNLELKEIEELFKFNPYDHGELKLISNEGQILADINEDLIGEMFPLYPDHDMTTDEPSNIQAKINGKDSIVTFMPTTIKDWNLIQTISLDEVTQNTSILKKNNTIILVIFLLINFILVIILSVWIYHPIQNLLLDLTHNDTSNLQVKDYKFIELKELNRQYLDLLERINELDRKNYMSQIALKESELRTLYSQINPHVLFNTLQLLQTEIVFGNQRESNQIILSLSNLLRYSMNQRDDLIEVSQEIKYIKDYLFIMNKKFIDQIDLHVDVSEEILQAKTIKLSIQPIVENCIKHGLQEGAGQIIIRGKLITQGIVITIKDNGIGISKEKINQLNKFLESSDIVETNHIGLHNVNQRIKYKFGNDYGIRVESKVNEYTEVMIYIPKVAERM